MDHEDDGYGTFGDDELDDEPAAKKKRVATSTKVILVVGGWLLLTLFLVGQFSKGSAGPDTVSAQLDTVNEDFDDGGTPDVVDTDAELVFDSDGDGYLDETERAAVVEAYEAAVASGEVVVGEPWHGTVSEGSALATDDGATAAPAVPGAGPASDASASAAPPGLTSETTTTTTKPGGATSTTTTTTKSGGTSSTTTTAKAAPASTTTTTAADAAPVDRAITVSGNPSGFSYDPRSFSVPSGSRVKMVNRSTAAHTWQIGDGAPKPLPKDGTIDYQTITSTVSYRCTIHPGMEGTITVG